MSNDIVIDYEYLENESYFTTWRINESVKMVFVAVAYLNSITGIPNRKTLDRLRDLLIANVKYEKRDFHGPSNPGGYIFDRDSLWNDFFLKLPRFRKVIEHRHIRSLDELEISALEYQEDVQPRGEVSLDGLIEQGIENFDIASLSQRPRNRNIRYED